MLLGFDISNNNPGVNMVQAYAQGCRFGFAKASQGWNGGPGGWMDWTFVDIVTRARAAGILPGGYHWLLKGNGAAQAELFVQSLQRAGGPHGLLCGLDIEETEWNTALNADPQTVDDFLGRWDVLTDRQPLFLYGASWYHDGVMHAGNAWPNRPLWWAGYTPVGVEAIELAVDTVTPGYMSPFGGWNSYAIRQFTSNGIAGGEQVDADVTYLSIEELQAMTQPTTGGNVTPDVAAALAALNKKVDSLQLGINQLVTVIQGVQPGKPNPFGLIGLKDLARDIAGVKTEVDLVKAKVSA